MKLFIFLKLTGEVFCLFFADNMVSNEVKKIKSKVGPVVLGKVRALIFSSLWSKRSRS